MEYIGIVQTQRQEMGIYSFIISSTLDTLEIQGSCRVKKIINICFKIVLLLSDLILPLFPAYTQNFDSWQLRYRKFQFLIASSRQTFSQFPMVYIMSIQHTLVLAPIKVPTNVKLLITCGTMWNLQ